MRTACFNPAHGDRSDAPNVAILITDGIPTREVNMLEGEVNIVKSLGIHIIGVGVTNKVRVLLSTSLSEGHIGRCTKSTAGGTGEVGRKLGPQN